MAIKVVEFLVILTVCFGQGDAIHITSTQILVIRIVSCYLLLLAVVLEEHYGSVIQFPTIVFVGPLDVVATVAVIVGNGSHEYTDASACKIVCAILRGYRCTCSQFCHASRSNSKWSILLIALWSKVVLLRAGGKGECHGCEDYIFICFLHIEFCFMVSYSVAASPTNVMDLKVSVSEPPYWLVVAQVAVPSSFCVT